MFCVSLYSKAWDWIRFQDLKEIRRGAEQLLNVATNLELDIKDNNVGEKPASEKNMNKAQKHMQLSLY